MFVLCLSILAVTHLASGQTVADCPSTLPRDQYLQVQGDSCFLFVPYRQVSYDDAQAACAADGGTLVLVKTQAMEDYVYGELKNTYQFTEDVWIGLQDKNTESKFVWEDGTDLQFSNWGAGEGPNNFNIFTDRQLEDCVTINPSTGKWKDYPCSGSSGGIFSFFGDSSHPYICQYKIGGATFISTTLGTSTTRMMTTTATTAPPPMSTTIGTTVAVTAA